MHHHVGVASALWGSPFLPLHFALFVLSSTGFSRVVLSDSGQKNLAIHLNPGPLIGLDRAILEVHTGL